SHQSRDSLENPPHSAYQPTTMPAPSLLASVRGHLQHAEATRDRNAHLHLNQARQLADDDAHSTFDPNRSRVNTCVTVHTEGQTDALHLLRAFAYFRDDGKYPGLELEIPVNPDMNDSNLWRLYNSRLGTTLSLPVVCLFDRDVPSTVER